MPSPGYTTVFSGTTPQGENKKEIDGYRPSAAPTTVPPTRSDAAHDIESLLARLPNCNQAAARLLTISALVGGTSNFELPRAWIGWGVTRSNDADLPVDCLGMLLLSKALGDKSPTILLADTHAIEGGHEAESIQRRTNGRAEHLERVAPILGMSPTVVRASQLLMKVEYTECQQIAKRIAEGASDYDRCRFLTPYSVRAIGDCVYFTKNLGTNIKVGWVPRPQLEPGKGGFSEFNGTDRFVRDLLPEFVAAYSGPGVTLDSKRPKETPYSVQDAHLRLMLTGADRGEVQRKLDAASAHQRRDVLLQIDCLTAAFELLVDPLNGDNGVDKLEDLIARTNA